MFAEQRPQDNRRWRVAQVASLAAHCVVIFFLARQPKPLFIQPSSVMAGSGGNSTVIVYLPSSVPLGEKVAAAPHPKITAPALRPRKPAPPAPVLPKAEGETSNGADQVRAARAGTPYGSLDSGPAYGPEIRPALPTSFRDPAVFASDLPPGVRGDVIVEITIDAQGNIVEKKLIKTLGYGVDEKVLAAIEGWRFRPATRDGVPIPSQQYMHFHFPS